MKQALMHFGSAIAYPKDKLQHYGDVHHIDGSSVQFLVIQESLMTTVSNLLADLEVINLSIGDPPIDEIIGQVFQAGQI